MKPLIIICLAAALLSCKKETASESINVQVSSNSVSHDYNSKISYPVDVEMYSQCTGEYVHITGTVQLKYHATMKEDGAYHITAHDRNVDMQGVGVTSGRRYRVIGNYNSTWNYELKGGVYKVVSKSVMTTPGGKNNLVTFSAVNFVTTADGTLKVIKIEDTLKCQ
jgi:hypothetical protein